MKAILRLVQNLPPAKFQMIEDAIDSILGQGVLNRSDKRRLERFLEKSKSSRR